MCPGLVSEEPTKGKKHFSLGKLMTFHFILRHTRAGWQGVLGVPKSHPLVSQWRPKTSECNILRSPWVHTAYSVPLIKLAYSNCHRFFYNYLSTLNYIGAVGGCSSGWTGSTVTVHKFPQSTMVAPFRAEACTLIKETGNSQETTSQWKRDSVSTVLPEVKGRGSAKSSLDPLEWCHFVILSGHSSKHA